jgi:hypothetical protein
MAKGGSGGGAGNEVSLPPPSGTEESFSQWSLERDPTPAVSAAAPSSAAAGIVPHLQVHRTSQPSRVRGATTNIIQQQGIHISVSSERTSGGPPCGEAAPSPHSARRKKTGLRFSDLQTDLRTGTISRRRGEQTQVVVGNYVCPSLPLFSQTRWCSLVDELDSYGTRGTGRLWRRLQGHEYGDR